MMYKVKDHRNLVRDSSSKAVLNMDREKMLELQNKKRTKENIENLNEEVSSLKKDINEIKTLLQQFVARGQ